MLLMAKCPYHITSNSSFSWWAAYILKVLLLLLKNGQRRTFAQVSGKFYTKDRYFNDNPLVRNSSHIIRQYRFMWAIHKEGLI